MGVFGNLDDTFAYQTTKIVKIRDKRLGLLKLTLLIGIVIFILLYQLLYMNNYLKVEAPTGTIRYSIREPLVHGCKDLLKEQNCTANMTEVGLLPYCAQNKNCESCQKNCTYLDSLDIAQTEEKSLLVTTYLETMKQTKTACGEDPMAGERCPRIWDNLFQTPDSAYVADVENFTLLIDHAFTTDSSFGLTKSARSMAGRLECSNMTICNKDTDPRDPANFYAPWTGNGPCLLTPKLVGDGTNLNYFTIGELLASQSIDLDRLWVGGHPQRKTGAIMLVEIEYLNSRPWMGVYPSYKHVWYIIRVKPVDDSTYKGYTIDNTGPGNRTVYTKYGLRLSTVLIGNLGKFDVTTLLLQLTTSLSLLAVATVVVDALALYVMKEKDVYSKSKYEETEKFGKDILKIDMMKRNNSNDDEELLLPVN